MDIRYANAHKWEKSVQTDPFGYFGKNSTARIRSSLHKIAEAGISTRVQPVNENFLNKFIPMYEHRINSKDNPRVFDIKSKTLTESKKQYYSLELFEKDNFLGASIFSLPKDKLSIAYRTYENDWRQADLQAKPSLYTEYMMGVLALEYNCNKIIHGKDLNPYGINSNIGLAAFKLAAGCQPKKCKTYETHELTTTDLTTDTLVFEYPGDDAAEIKKGYLITNRQTEHKWTQVTKYPHLVEIEVMYLN